MQNQFELNTIAKYHFSTDIESLDIAKKVKMISKIEEILKDCWYDNYKNYDALNVFFNYARNGKKITPHIEIREIFEIFGQYVEVFFQYDFESGLLSLSGYDEKTNKTSYELIRDAIGIYTDYHETQTYDLIDFMLNHGHYPELSDAKKYIKMIWKSFKSLKVTIK